MRDTIRARDGLHPAGEKARLVKKDGGARVDLVGPHLDAIQPPIRDGELGDGRLEPDEIPDEVVVRLAWRRGGYLCVTSRGRRSEAEREELPGNTDLLNLQNHSILGVVVTDQLVRDQPARHLV